MLFIGIAYTNDDIIRKPERTDTAEKVETHKK